MPKDDTGPDADLIGALIGSFADWRGAALERIRSLIHEVDPEIIEEIKWRKPSNPAGVPVWSHAGILCTGEIYTNKVKLTFAKGAQLDDPERLFNSSLDGKIRRAIDILHDSCIDEQAFKSLFRAAIALNTT